MAEDPLKFRRDTPPETKEDWGNIWLSVERTNAAWPIIGPLVAVKRNWYAIAAVLAILGWLNWSRIAQIAALLAGGGQ
jgi:hypothetical protein